MHRHELEGRLKRLRPRGEAGDCGTRDSSVQELPVRLRTRAWSAGGASRLAVLGPRSQTEPPSTARGVHAARVTENTPRAPKSWRSETSQQTRPGREALPHRRSAPRPQRGPASSACAGFTTRPRAAGAPLTRGSARPKPAPPRYSGTRREQLGLSREQNAPSPDVTNERPRCPRFQPWRSSSASKAWRDSCEQALRGAQSDRQGVSVRNERLVLLVTSTCNERLFTFVVQRS